MIRIVAIFALFLSAQSHAAFGGWDLARGSSHHQGLVETDSASGAVQAIQCERRLAEHKKQARWLRGKAEGYRFASNAFTEIAYDARKLSRVSAGLAIASSGLMMSASLATYFLSLNPGLIGSITLFARTPGAAAGAALSLSALAPLKLASVSTVFSDAVVVAVSFAAAHAESVYLVARGVYIFATQRGPIQITNADIDQSEEALLKALGDLNREIGSSLDSPPSGFRNAVTLGGANAKHFRALAELGQTRALIAEQLAQLAQLKTGALNAECKAGVSQIALVQ